MFGGKKKINMVLKIVVVLALLANLAVYGLHIARKAMAIAKKQIESKKLSKLSVGVFYGVHLGLVLINVVCAFVNLKSNAKIASSFLLLAMLDLAVLVVIAVFNNKVNKGNLIPSEAEFKKVYDKYNVPLLSMYSVAAFISVSMFAML